jgi:tetratricopeptide (TPR) repeat protein
MLSKIALAKITSRISSVFVGLGLLFTATTIMIAAPVAKPAVFPLTTKSPEARRLVDEALVLYIDHVAQPEAIASLRKAVEIDPQFAMGHELLAQISLDSAEQVSEQQKAFSTRRHASPSEKTIIEWYQDAADNKLISAITKMNDAVNQYPNDKLVVWMTTWWLMTQAQYERALAIYEQSGIQNSPGLLNNMAYNYADLRQFDKAIALMDKYAASLPGDPNPEDSYAEILRLAGRFDKSIQHYQAVLAANPQFYSSQFGLADTYSLMGNQVQARKEYKTGFEKFHLEEMQQVMWQTREAATYIREGDYKSADGAFQAVANSAHERHICQVEADTYRQMAIYQQDSMQALYFLDKADVALNEGKNTTKTAIQEESAQILRARVELAVKTGRKDATHAFLTQLASMSESSSDKLVELAYHGAYGAVLYSERNYNDAISHLEEDANNPLSLQLLADAYRKTGNTSAAKRIADTLANVNDPTVEQALVVPEFRKCSQDPSCSGNLKNVSFPQ